jgi:hypothetical protein
MERRNVMTDAATTLVNDQDAPNLSQTERVVNTFIEPSKTFNDIKRNRSWWLPFLIMAVLGYIFCVVAVQHVGWDSLVTNAMKSSPRNVERMDKATPAELAQMVSVGKVFTQVIMAATPLVILIINAIIALLLWGGFAFVLGGVTTFGEMFTVAMFAALPNALSTLASIATIFASDPQGYNINVKSPACLAYFLDPTASAWLKSLGMSLDLFSIWSLILAGLGGALVAKVKPARGIAMVVIVWLLFVIIKVGIAAAFS